MPKRTTSNNENRNLRLLAAAAVFLLLWLHAGLCAAQSFTEPVYASILATSPGEKVYQCTGHAAVRLQCPDFDLDNVFSFETSSENTGIQILGRVKGRFSRIATSEYIDQFRTEGREVKEYPLNLTDSQIRTLWQLLDEASELGAEEDFNIRYRNCSSEILLKINEALGTDRIRMHDRIGTMDNAARIAELIDEDRPWTKLLLTIAIGADCDKTDPDQAATYPVMMAERLPKATIVSADGTERPLLGAEPKTLLRGAQRTGSHGGLGPVAIALVVLALSAVVSIAERTGRCRSMVKAADIAALAAESAAAAAIIVLAVIPSGIGHGWHWMFIPLNLLPLLTWAFLRKTPAYRIIFIAYGAACALFTASPLFTSESGAAGSIISGAIAIRVLSHFLSKTIKSL